MYQQIKGKNIHLKVLIQKSWGMVHERNLETVAREQVQFNQRVGV
jgi:hypothetical protein